MKKKYFDGGQLGSILSTIAPLAAAIPGAGVIASPALAIAGGLLQQSSQETPQTRRFSKGGRVDSSLSSSSFKVNGNPNTKDSEKYSNGIYLDDKEVVDVNTQFVFSDRINNPYTNNTFAKDAAKIHSSIGKAEARVKTTSGDPFAENTVKALKKMSSNLEGLHEIVKTADKISTNKMADGGPVDPLPGQQYMQVRENVYYDPYNNRTVYRNPHDGSYIPWVEKKRKAPQEPQYGLPRGVNFTLDQIQDHLRQFPGSGESPITSGTPTSQPASPEAIPFISQTGTPYPVGMYPPNKVEATPQPASPKAMPYISQTGTPYPLNIYPPNKVEPQPSPKPEPWTVDPLENFNTPKKTKSPTPVPLTPKPVAGTKTSATVSPLPTTQIESSNLPDGKVVTPLQPIPYFREGQTPYNNDPLRPVSSLNTAPPKIQGPKVIEEAPLPNTNIDPRFTVGDAMQLVTVGSKIVDAARKPEREKPNLDNTKITKQGYDPTRQLAQSSRNYKTAVEGISTISPNLRRAMQNQAYSNKLEQDSNIISRYDEMNKGAQTQYEDRLSNQRRFNTQKIDYTQDINARNRAAAANSRTAAFDTVGYTGQALNNRKYQYDRLQLQAELYPQVYQRFIQEYLLNGQ